MTSHSQPYVEILSADPKTFFYLLFKQESIEGMTKLINDRVDFAELDKKMKAKASPSASDPWKKFVNFLLKSRIVKEIDFSKFQLDNFAELERFIEALLARNTDSNTLTEILNILKTISAWDGKLDSLYHPLYLIHTNRLRELTYTIDSNFDSNVLYLGQYVNYF